MTTTDSNFIGDFLRDRFSADVAPLANGILSVISMVAFMSLSAILLVWAERKVCARFQARLGPTRVGPFGLLQPIADGIKLLLKEHIRPRAADPIAYYLAPLLPVMASFMIMAVLPIGSTLQVVDLDVGVLYVSAMSGFGILGVLIAGWSSNNKYSLLGAMRSGAQLFSYELSMILCMLLVVMASGTASLRGIVESQQGTILDWWVFNLPGVGLIGFLLFIISSTAELNRGPLDLSEAESELTGGFHTEYTGMGFAMFFLAEYINLFAAAGLGTTFFLGGYLPPAIGISSIDSGFAALPGCIWFLSKASLLIFIYMWLRWTYARLRIDHLLNLEWKFLLPTSMANLLAAATLISLGWYLS